MQSSEHTLREEIVEIGRLVYQKGWVASNDGNISVRLEPNRILSTPTRISKGRMRPDDLIIVDASGRKVCGDRECTSEIAMHLTIYALRPDVQAVVHAHPPIATGFAVAGRALNQALLPEIVLSLGTVPLAGYGLPGTPELTQGMMEFIPKYDALLMANHGAVAYGGDLWDAFHKLEATEHFARISLVAELLGGPRILPRREVEKLFAARGRYGISSNAEMAPGAPVVAEDREKAPREIGSLTRDELLDLIHDALSTRLQA
jgi:L-fuculose-phosphate aldolase